MLCLVLETTRIIIFMNKFFQTLKKWIFNYFGDFKNAISLAEEFKNFSIAINKGRF